ncbi:MAG: hypothetical protein ACETVR_01105 [Candidatus Bathyarchaeia archaeon]
MVEVEEKRREEIPVVLPGRIEVPPDREKTEEEARRKEERRGVIGAARVVGVLISGLTITVGLLLTLISAYQIFTGSVIDLMVRADLFSIILLLLGVVNITSGLLLMGRGEVEEK